jgi:hypothetical protein
MSGIAERLVWLMRLRSDLVQRLFASDSQQSFAENARSQKATKMFASKRWHGFINAEIHGCHHLIMIWYDMIVMCHLTVNSISIHFTLSRTSFNLLLQFCSWFVECKKWQIEYWWIAILHSDLCPYYRIILHGFVSFAKSVPNILDLFTTTFVLVCPPSKFIKSNQCKVQKCTFWLS